MLNTKEQQILKLLYKNRDHYITSQKIAEKLGVSDRTARKYLNVVKEAIEQQEKGTIASKKGQGYYLVIHQQDAFNKFYQEEIHNVLCKRDITSIHESKDRQYYMLNKLFFEQDHILLDNIADELFVSRSTLSKDLLEVKKSIKPYDIKLKSKANTGLYVQGSERNIRHFMMNYFFMDRLQDNFYTFSKYANLLEGVSIEEIVIIVLDECREARLKLSDFIIFNLVLHIALALKRLESGFEIGGLNVVAFSKHSIEYQTALKILSRIEESFTILIPLEEATYIATHLQNKLAKQVIFQQTCYDNDQINEELFLTLKKMDQELGYHFSQDKILINGLLLHFTSLLLRLEQRTSFKNPLLDEIKTHYAKLFEATVHYFSKMPVFERYQITESEWAYLTIHLTAAVERFFNQQKAKVLVICATGFGSSQMLKSRIEHEFGSKIVVQKVISYYEIADQDLSNIDLIISSINIPMVFHKIPIVHVSVFLGEKDIEKIHQKLVKYKKSTPKVYLNSEQKTPKIVDNQTLIEQVFDPTLFFRFEARGTKKSVLSRLLSGIEKCEGEAIVEAFEKQLQLREMYSSVVFSNYLAVPHPIEAVTKSAYVAVAIAPKGIVWDQEHQDIQLVFLLSPALSNHAELEKLSQMLVPIIENDEFRKKLVKSTDFPSFKTCFLRQK